MILILLILLLVMQLDLIATKLMIHGVVSSRISPIPMRSVEQIQLLCSIHVLKKPTKYYSQKK